MYHNDCISFLLDFITALLLVTTFVVNFFLLLSKLVTILHLITLFASKKFSKFTTTAALIIVHTLYHFESDLEHTKFLEKVLLIQIFEIFKNWIFLFNITYIFQDI